MPVQTDKKYLGKETKNKDLEIEDSSEQEFYKRISSLGLLTYLTDIGVQEMHPVV